jgi:hypothetical protein
MVKLLRQVHSLDRARKLLGTAALLAACSLWIFDLRPSVRQENLQNAHLIDAADQLQARTDNEAGAAHAVDEAGRLVSTIEAAAPRIAPDQLARELTVLARQTGVRRLAIQSGLPGEYHALSDCPVVIEFQGDMLSSLDFLRQSETGARPARMQGLHIRAIDANPGQFEVQASLDFYGAQVP